MGEGSGYETSLKDVHAVSTTASTASVHGYCGGWQCMYIQYHVMSFENTSHHLAYVSQIMNYNALLFLFLLNVITAHTVP